MKRFATGLIVGKFAPLHAGHERLIGTAFAQCEKVLIISYTRPELPDCDPGRRERWLRVRFPNARILVIGSQDTAQLGLPAMPYNDDDADEHRRFVAAICERVLGTTVDAVFTAEDYGDGFSAVLTQEFRKRGLTARPVAHVRLERGAEPGAVSGTLLRSNIHHYRHHVAPEVYADFVQRIGVLGGESSGKSTLSLALARALDTVHIEEYGREFWEACGGKLVFDDMLHIAQTQVAREETAPANHYLVCDTSPLTTLFYSYHLFGLADSRLEALAGRTYDVNVLCAPDFPFIQDGTRQNEAFRQMQFDWYQAELSRRAIPFLVVSGSVAQRIKHILACLPNMSSQPTPKKLVLPIR